MCRFYRAGVLCLLVSVHALVPSRESVALAAGRHSSEKYEAAPTSLEIVIEKQTQVMTVYVDGSPRYGFRVSTGRPSHPTPSGRFHPLFLTRMAYAPKYDNAPMPWSIFFTPYGHAIHETGYLETLGLPVSHGCVRLTPEAAQLLYALVKRIGLKETTIEIY